MIVSKLQATTMVRDWLHPPRITGTISEVGKDFWCAKCERMITGRTTPLIHETNVHLCRERSRAKGHNYCHDGSLWKCNYCPFENRNLRETKAHLEHDHYYEIHPDKVPKLESPLNKHLEFLESGLWRCKHCGFTGRENKVLKHLEEAHTIQTI
jgi:hypothetical protein